MARQTTLTRALAALDRIKKGKPTRSSGELTASALAEEAGIGRATLYRCPEALQALEEAKLGRSTGARAPAPPAVPVASSERELREAVQKLASRIHLLGTIIRSKDAEIERLRKQGGSGASNVVPLPTPAGTGVPRRPE